MSSTQDPAVTALILAGGPDAEREVSIKSANAIFAALRESPRYRPALEVIDAPTSDELAGLVRDSGAGVVFPALHGRWGEGGPLQRRLDAAGVAYVGAGPQAARTAMDKAATKAVALCVLRAFPKTLPVAVSTTWIIDPGDETPPCPLPFVAKPNFEGSTVGLHIVRSEDAWAAALADLRKTRKPYIAEPLAEGRELTCGLLLPAPHGVGPLPLIQITPAQGLYDYQAKYLRDDTRYDVDGVASDADTEAIVGFSEALTQAMGIRHLARADFMYDDRTGLAHFLEINTMPGFTDHSLLPMAAARAGLGMTALCESLLDAALQSSPATLTGAKH
jgi:D-alanine-D-alanine ligase